MSTKYSEKDKLKISYVLGGLRDICRTTDARLAELLAIHRTNVAAFNSQRRLGAVTVGGINKMLKKFGLCFSPTQGLKSADGEHCPVAEMQVATEADAKRLQLFIEVLHEYANVYLCPILNSEGDFALVWDTKLSKTQWCCVGLGLGPENPAFKCFKEHSLITEGPAIEVSTELYQTWLDTAPRRTEVLDACAPLFRQIKSQEMVQHIASAMSDDLEVETEKPTDQVAPSAFPNDLL